jgi:hypothetical protein
METFWENIVDLGKLIIKVLLMLWTIDVVCVVASLEYRVPYLSKLTDWLFIKISVLS